MRPFPALCARLHWDRCHDQVLEHFHVFRIHRFLFYFNGYDIKFYRSRPPAPFLRRPCASTVLAFQLFLYLAHLFLHFFSPVFHYIAKISALLSSSRIIFLSSIKCSETSVRVHFRAFNFFYFGAWKLVHPSFCKIGCINCLSFHFIYCVCLATCIVAACVWLFPLPPRWF